MTQGEIRIPITFEFIEGSQAGRRETLTERAIKIGSQEPCHLLIDDPDVARMHAVIEVADSGEVSVIDLGSAAGTVCNGAKVANKATLQNGDILQLGGTKIVLTMGQPASQPAAQPPQAAQSVPPQQAAPVPPAQSAPPAQAAQPFQPPVPPQQPAEAAQPNPFRPPPIAATPGAAAVPTPFGAGQQQQQSAGDGDNVQYQFVASGPPVNPADIDTGEQALEVVVMWGERSVLHVEHLSPPRAYYVGDATDTKGKPATDFLIGSESLGTERLPITTDSGAVVIPQGATGDVTIGEQRHTFEELAAAGQVQPSAELAGAQQYALPQGATARVSYRGFVFVVKPVSAARRVGVGGSSGLDWRTYIWTIASVLLHTSLLLMFYFLPPNPSSLALDLLDADSRLVKYLIEPPETVEEETPDWLQDNKDDQEGGKGKRHKDEEGQMGKKEAKKTKNKFGIEGPEDNQDPHMAREEAKEQARNAGIIGVLKASVGSWNAPTSPYGRDTALGNDPMSALGALMGDQVGENFGFGGLGLRGTGRGGGGTGEGTIGLGNLGTIGHGAGGGTGSGYGRGAGGFKGRKAKVPRIRTGRADVRGSLSKEVIRRIIRRHINEVRFCYEQELNTRPDLQGRVAVKFIISPTGAVQAASVANSSLGNPRAENCIAQAVRRWTFPSPEGGGIVVVTYPFKLQQVGG